MFTSIDENGMLTDGPVNDRGTQANFNWSALGEGEANPTSAATAGHV